MKKRRKYVRRFHHTTNRLRVLRAERRWTQDDVSRRLGYITKFRYWQLENEETHPTPQERKQLAKIFNCSEKTIFPSIVRAA